jgi:steroid 5-alpha reductase family enzyme
LLTLYARWLFYFSDPATYPTSYFFTPKFIVGFLLFVTGMFINQQSDTIVLTLKKSTQTKQKKEPDHPQNRYKIPRGGFFEYVSSANYFGEMVEWFGYYIMTDHIGSLSFFIWTVANLFPRAISNHKWYKSHFSDYPKDRKAVIPFIF